MDIMLKSTAGYILNEYLLVLSPNLELWEKIIQIKKNFSEEFDAPIASFTKPHITLVRFINWQIAEDRITQRLEAIASSIKPAKIELTDFGSLPSHTIFFNVTSRLPVQGIVKQLKTIQQLLKPDNDNKPHFMEEPHILLCNKLKPWQYEKAWQMYSHLHFSGKFIADGMHLFKRAKGEKKYNLLRKFDFLNQSVTSEQGSLFH